MRKDITRGTLQLTDLWPPLLPSPLSLFSFLCLFFSLCPFFARAFFISRKGSRLSFSFRSLFSCSSLVKVLRFPLSFSFLTFSSFSFSSSLASRSLRVFRYQGVASVPGAGPRDTSRPMARSCFSWEYEGARTGVVSSKTDTPRLYKRLGGI